MMTSQKTGKPPASFIYDIALVLLLLFVVFSRLMLSSDHPHPPSDEVEFVEAIAKGALYAHPPGYILYIVLARLLNVFFQAPYTSLVYISVIFSVLAIVSLYDFVTKLYGAKQALIVSLLLSLNPLAWYYGIRGFTYMITLFFTITCANVIYQAIKFKKESLFYLFSFLWPLGAGFRQDLMLFLAPLWVLGVCRFPRLKTVVVSSTIVAIVFLAWFIPLAGCFGGFYGYTKTFIVFSNGAWSQTTFFSRGFQTALKYFLMWCGFSFWALGPVLFFIIPFFKKKFRGPFFKNAELTTVLLAWFLPSFLFFMFLHFSTAGYIFAHLGVFYILAAHVFYETELTCPARKMILPVVLSCFISASQFFIAIPLPEKNNCYLVLNRLFYRFTRAALEAEFLPRDLFNKISR